MKPYPAFKTMVTIFVNNKNALSQEDCAFCMLNQNLSVLGHKNDDGFHKTSFQKGKLINLNLTVLSFNQKREQTVYIFSMSSNLDLKSLKITEIQIGPTQKLCFETFYEVSYHVAKLNT